MPDLPLTTPVSSSVLALVNAAKDGRLAVCAGAGLSMGPDLPSGKELAQKIHAHFNGLAIGYFCDKPDHLPTVASAVAALPSGIELLQRCIFEKASLDTAPPKLGHKLLALLAAEGAIKILTTNWDDCLERGWVDERILAARDPTEAEGMPHWSVLKVHGCCSLPSTLLVTEDQLQDPPLWTKDWFQAFISTSTMVFLGVGDVAPYVREPIARLAEYVDGARVRVVSPGIVQKWDSSQWKDVLPDLSLDRRLAMTADSFADELSRGWLSQLVRDLHDGWQSEAVRDSADAFSSLSALRALSWLRRSASGWKVGASVARSAEARSALAAVGLLAMGRAIEPAERSHHQIEFAERASVRIGNQHIEVLIALPNQSTTSLERIMRRRAENLTSELGLERVAVLCSASMPVGPRQLALSQDDVFTGAVATDDLLVGPTQARIEVLWADKILEAA